MVVIVSIGYPILADTCDIQCLGIIIEISPIFKKKISLLQFLCFDRKAWINNLTKQWTDKCHFCSFLCMFIIACKSCWWATSSENQNRGSVITDPPTTMNESVFPIFWDFTLLHSKDNLIIMWRWATKSDFHTTSIKQMWYRFDSHELKKIKLMQKHNRGNMIFLWVTRGIRPHPPFPPWGERWLSVCMYVHTYICMYFHDILIAIFVLISANWWAPWSYC